MFSVGTCGNTETESERERENVFNVPTWENTVIKHVEATASNGLRRMCALPHMTLAELEKEAGKVGMDKAELDRALRFLHTTGSVFHYGVEHTSPVLQKTVFMQPQFIADAIKYVIREPNAENFNEELREMDARIRRDSEAEEELDRFLGHARGDMDRVC